MIVGHGTTSCTLIHVSLVHLARLPSSLTKLTTLTTTSPLSRKAITPNEILGRKPHRVCDIFLDYRFCDEGHG